MLAFKSTTIWSRLRVMREVEAIGGNVTACASREQMGHTFEASKIYVPQMIEKLKAEIGDEHANNPEDFGDESLLSRINSTVLEDFVHVGRSNAR